MASTTTKWIVGCSIGCGALILLMVALSVGTYYTIREVVEDVKESEAAMEALTERYGRVSDFTPDADGVIEPTRMETFLRARDVMMPFQTDLSESLGVLADAQESGEDASSGSFLEKMQAGLNLVPGIFAFHAHRSEALLEAGMGLGEYRYIYAMSYYSWLARPPADGPPFTLVGDTDVRIDAGSSFDDDDWGDQEEFEVRESRAENILGRLHREILPMLRRQQAALERLEARPDEDVWRRALADEISALEADRFRIPWQDGLPDVLRQSLEPFKARLEASYSPMCNPLEMGMGHD
jgi:hypothetical protein